MTAITGTNQNDTLTGTSGADVIDGKNGNDIINAGDGNDIVEGGQGNDILNGESGNDILNGGQGDDILDGGIGNDIITGGQGDDIIRFSQGIDFIDGSQGLDRIVFEYNRSAYRVELIVPGHSDYRSDWNNLAVYKVTEIATGSVSTFTNIESLVFADRMQSPLDAARNNPPTDILLSHASINENATGVVGLLSATDPDSVVGMTFSLVPGMDASKFSIVGNQLILNDPADYEALADHELHITLRVTDAGGLSFDKVMTIQIHDVNEAPVISAVQSVMQVPENSAETLVATLAITDDALGSNTLVLEGADADKFILVGNELHLKANVDFESLPLGDKVLDVSVKAVDGALMSNILDFHVEITNVNEAPIFNNADDVNKGILENSTEVLTLTTDLPATDPDGNPLAYSISGGADADKFTIDNGKLVFINAPNFETPTDSGANNVYDVIVRVSDGPLYSDKTVHVTVTDVLENIVVMSVNDSVVEEGQTVEFIVSLDHSAITPISVDYITYGGTASGIFDADYEFSKGSITFNPGELSKSIFVQTFTDDFNEGNETFNLVLTNPHNATVIDNQGIATIVDTSIENNAIPIFNSKLGAENIIYLDFDGSILQHTVWNMYFSQPQIDALGFSLDSDFSSFSSSEQAWILNVWERVSEDFLPFDVNVTTSFSLFNNTSPEHSGTVVITDYGNLNAGGIAYVDVYDLPGTYYDPAWVFYDKLSDVAFYTAEAASHEMGHNLGLTHDGLTSGAEYYIGSDGWAPIMGTSYYQSVSQWSKGEYPLANNTQDDLQIISGVLGYRADDYGNDFGLSANIDIHLGRLQGVISGSDDMDMFKFSLEAGASFSILASPFESSDGPNGANLDIGLKLYDEALNLILFEDPQDTLFVQTGLINAEITDKTYYLSIDGVGRGDPLTGGYSDYGSLGYYELNFQII